MAYDLFVSHAWSYSDRYHDTLRLLDLASENLSWFSYRNYSVPKHDPLVGVDEKVKVEKLTAMLKEQIRQASAVIIPAGMYVANRPWIQVEINLAKTGFTNPKPLIGIRRRGQQVTPSDLIEQCNEIVNWNSNSLAEAIRRQC